MTERSVLGRRRSRERRRSQDPERTEEEATTYSRDDDEHGFVDEFFHREQRQAEVDEDEVLAQLHRSRRTESVCGTTGSEVRLEARTSLTTTHLREGSEHVPRRALSSMRHVVVRVMLERDAAEQERHDTFSSKSKAQFGDQGSMEGKRRDRVSPLMVSALEKK